MVANEIIVAGAVVTAVAVTPIALGFGVVGVGAATTAAAIQSSIGCVQAGSLFATMTSLGMKGAFVKTALAGSGSMIVGVVPKIKGLFWG